MNADQAIKEILKDQLMQNVHELFNEGYRMVQMNCSDMNDSFCLDYSFEKDLKLLNLRVMLPKENANMISISSIYFPACLYENEIHDLFGVDYVDLAIDFKGKFYRTKKKAAFANENQDIN